MENEHINLEGAFESLALNSDDIINIFNDGTTLLDEDNLNLTADESDFKIFIQIFTRKILSNYIFIIGCYIIIKFIISCGRRYIRSDKVNE